MSSLNSKLRTTPLTSRKLATRRKICDAARDLFYTQGFDGTTIDQIATLAGTRRSTIYTHFRDKNEILSALTEDCLEPAREIIARIPSPAPSHEEIDCWIQEFAKLAAEEQVVAALLVGTAASSHQVPDAVIEFGDVVLTALAERLPAFKQAQKSGLDLARALAVLRQLGWALVHQADDSASGEFHLRVAGEWFNAFIRNHEHNHRL